MELCFITFMTVMHIKKQEVINVDQFHKIIKFIGKKNILNPKDFIHLNLKKN